jgi:hypothetical protein
MHVACKVLPCLATELSRNSRIEEYALEETLHLSCLDGRSPIGKKIRVGLAVPVPLTQFFRGILAR